MRCLVLAAMWQGAGAQVVFICREQEGHLCDFIGEQGFPVLRLARSDRIDSIADARTTMALLAVRWDSVDCLLVDHYGLDIRWETTLRAVCKRIAVIDDLADREHDCDVLLDQNYCHGMEARYDHLLRSPCQRLLGPEFALLRPEFWQARARLRPRSGDLKRILVFFGGSDPGNETAKALHGLQQIGRRAFSVDVVVGSSNPHKDDIEAMCAAAPDMRYHCQVTRMAALMAEADLAIGAGGTTTWERCCLGLPALVAILADNQAGLTEAVADYGASISLGRSEALSPHSYRAAVEMLSARQLAGMAQRCVGLVDGKGAERVMDRLMQLEH